MTGAAPCGCPAPTATEPRAAAQSAKAGGCALPLTLPTTRRPPFPPRSGLTVGKKYELHRLTSLGAVPSSKAGRIGGAPDHAFTATAKTEKIDVSFASGKPAFFICTAA